MWEKNKGMNEEIRKEKCHLSCSKWEVRPCWPYTRQEHLPIYPLQNTTCTYIHLYTRQKHTGWRGLTFSFIQRGTKPFWINPCLRALVPSPSWIGLDSFLFLRPSIMNEHNSKFPDSSLPLNLVWRRTLDSLLYRKYFPLLPHAPSLSLLSLLLYFISFFFFFTGNCCCCCILWEWGIFFTWVSVEKGGQSIKFELLKTNVTSSDVVSIMFCFWERTISLYFCF